MEFNLSVEELGMLLAEAAQKGIDSAETAGRYTDLGIAMEIILRLKQESK